VPATRSSLQQFTPSVILGKDKLRLIRCQIVLGILGIAMAGQKATEKQKSAGNQKGH
jgi:hypothetical protein